MSETATSTAGNIFEPDNFGSSVPSDGDSNEHADMEGTEVNVEEGAPTEGKTSPKEMSSKPSKPLPPTRLIVRKQIEILRAYAGLSDNSRRRVSASDVTGITGISPSTIAAFSRFFEDSGLLISEPGTRGFKPSEELSCFVSRLSLNESEDQALAQLRPVIERTWFGSEVIQRIKSNRQREKDLITALGLRAGANVREYKGSLQQLIEWCEKTHLVRKNADGTYFLTNHEITTPLPPSSKPIESTETSTKDDNLGEIKRGGKDVILEAVENTFRLSTIIELEDSEREELLNAIKVIKKYAVHPSFADAL